MQTASFFTTGKAENCVCISRGKPKTFVGPTYEALAPLGWMLTAWKEQALDLTGFTDVYRKQVLGKLDPRKVFDDLGERAVLLCWEPFNIYCHRRLVAEWLEEKLGVVVPELGHDRSESLASIAMPASAPKPKKPQLFLF